jgi:hypothetical protein
LKHEVGRKPLDVAADSPFELFGGDAVEDSQVLIDQYFLTPDEENACLEVPRDGESDLAAITGKTVMRF